MIFSKNHINTLIRIWFGLKTIHEDDLVLPPDEDSEVEPLPEEADISATAMTPMYQQKHIEHRIA